MRRHDAFQWIAYLVDPQEVLFQEKLGPTAWSILEPRKERCVVLEFRPQSQGFRPIFFDLNPPELTLQRIAWVNSLRFGAGGLLSSGAQTVANKVVLRSLTLESREGTVFGIGYKDIYYFVMPDGSMVTSMHDIDKMESKMQYISASCCG